MALFKRNDKNTKKGGETTIGKIIYGFLLFAPLIAVFVKCGYVMFNKNAYQSYSGSYTYLDTTNYQTYIQNKPINPGEYNLNSTTYYYYSSTNFNNLEFESQNPYTDNLRNSGYIMFNCNTFNWQNTEYNDIQSAVVTKSGSNIIAYCYDIQITEDYYYNNGLKYLSNETTITPKYTTSYVYNQKLTFKTNLTINRIYTDKLNATNDYLRLLKFDIYLNDTTLSSVFYSAINETEQVNLFNWAKDTGTYTVLYNTTTGLGITNEFIPMLMAYWLIISIIYFLFDIALILIWLVHNKIHELQESV